MMHGYTQTRAAPGPLAPHIAHQLWEYGFHSAVPIPRPLPTAGQNPATCLVTIRSYPP
jgi:hypothetical protein